MKELLDSLKTLKSIYNVEGIKQSFEDEGVMLEDVMLMSRLTSFCKLYLNVKIGGCEAKTDIYNCNTMYVDGIVAPVIESEFALQKFVEAAFDSKTNLYINIESNQAVDNIETILGSPSAKLLKGIIVGRSDLAKSYGLTKQEVDSDFIYSKVIRVCQVAKSKNLKVGMGGNLTAASSDFVKGLYSNDLLDYIETRNVIISVNSDSVNNLETGITRALEFEMELMKFKYDKYSVLTKQYNERYNAIKNRLIF